VVVYETILLLIFLIVSFLLYVRCVSLENALLETETELHEKEKDIAAKEEDYKRMYEFIKKENEELHEKYE